MKNLMIVLTLILGVSIFSSCTKEECETCTYTFTWVDAEGVALEDQTADEHATEAMNAVMGTDANGELCDDALTDAKSAFEGMSDYADGMRSGAASTDVECCTDPADETHDAYHSHDIPAWNYTMTCAE
tara:strand:+ start:636 stop:1022 length:387 start_codon:yes stop_codon:yes gene_type:complete